MSGGNNNKIHPPLFIRGYLLQTRNETLPSGIHHPTLSKAVESAQDQDAYYIIKCHIWKEYKKYIYKAKTIEC